ncbi:hypothetical protein A2J03_08105 [Rhodococcus sp. EPR-157]|uniref:hypothetical protein n=1 Tax=Rhodococcus sp. EPR-157 TaxID=1813677 RepID=UPI0007BB1F0D|nr:hypothetical protein [Rhodococcus sp. EPR-157]KZF03262.1 hypothetical protein A2J03_08105 [Rhodococcus sp. EPR-157]
MAGQLFPLDGLPGRFGSMSYDGERNLIVVQVDDAQGNVMSSMSWSYSEPVSEPIRESDLIPCSGGCGCVYADDPELRECACDGACRLDTTWFDRPVRGSL